MVRSITTEQAALILQESETTLPESREVLIVEKNGAPVAVMISINEYHRISAAQRERDWEIIEGTRERNPELDPEEIEQVVEEEIKAYRHERRQRTARPA